MKRIQMKNYYDYSWKSNPNAVYCARPSKWGNPYKVSEYGLTECLRLYREWLIKQLELNSSFLEPLRGKDLVCYCNLNQKCHCDIIIEFLTQKRL